MRAATVTQVAAKLLAARACESYRAELARSMMHDANASTHDATSPSRSPKSKRITAPSRFTTIPEARTFITHRPQTRGSAVWRSLVSCTAIGQDDDALRCRASWVENSVTKTTNGADGKWYMYRVHDMMTFLAVRFGSQPRQQSHRRLMTSQISRGSSS
jgi:hypothetical protein